MWWIDDLFHEFVTVGFYVCVWYGAVWAFGHFLSTTPCRFCPIAFRWVNLALALTGSYFSLNLLVDHSLETGFTAELFVLAYFSAILIGFENRRILRVDLREFVFEILIGFENRRILREARRLSFWFPKGFGWTPKKDNNTTV